MAENAAQKKSRAIRGERWEAYFDPRALALAGALVSLAFLFQPLIGMKTALFFLFAAAALASGKKISIFSTVLVSAGIVLVNILVPIGKVLARVGPIAITETALWEGIDKALTFEGLMLISKASIRPGLRIPGRFGAVVASAFVYYDRILEFKVKIRPATLIADADELMLRVWEAEDPGIPAAAPPGSSFRKKGVAILVASVLVSFAALAAPFFGRL